MTTFAEITITRPVLLPTILPVESNVIRAEITRSVNAVGNWEILVRNVGGIYNAAFDVQNVLLKLDVNNVGDTLIKGKVDGPAVNLIGRDLEDIWDEYAIIKGVDNGQDLLFHNDFSHEYPDTAQEIKTVLDDVFNVHLKPDLPSSGSSIWYNTPVGATPPVGAFEFREGASFIGQIQELMKRAGFISYVDDSSFELKCGSPGFSAVPAPSTYRSIAGNTTNNIIGTVEYQTRDGDKHYNHIRLYGKAPMFDGYTEYNAVDWVKTSFAGNSTDDVLNDTNTKKVGGYSIVACSDATTTNCIGMRLISPVYNYNLFDMRQGEINIWAKYDNIAGVPGSAPPNAGGAEAKEHVFCFLTDNTGNQAVYWGVSSLLYENIWGYCTFPLGEGTGWVGFAVDSWGMVVGTSLDWEHIQIIEFVLLGYVGHINTPNPATPSHFYIDGIGLPFPILSIVDAAPEQITYRRRPYIDSWPHVRTQNALDSCALQVLQQSGTTLINKISFMTPGTKNLRYAGQSIDVEIPALGIGTLGFPEVYYITKLHHVIEPHVDVSKGYGFDWVTEIEAAPTSGVSYDQSRLGIGSLYSPTQKISRLGAGVR